MFKFLEKRHNKLKRKAYKEGYGEVFADYMVDHKPLSEIEVFVIDERLHCVDEIDMARNAGAAQAIKDLNRRGMA